MNSQTARRSSLFLMELLVAILFFLLASAVCVRLFVKSHTLERDSINLNHAVTAATTVAEIFRNQEAPYDLLKDQFPLGIQSEQCFCIFYNENWELCSFSESSYEVLLNTEISDSFVIGSIAVSEGDDLLYELNIKKYLEQEDF